MDRLYQAVGASGCCVLLADGEGVPVDRRGTPADDATFSILGPVDRRALERGA